MEKNYMSKGGGGIGMTLAFSFSFTTVSTSFSLFLMIFLKRLFWEFTLSLIGLKKSLSTYIKTGVDFCKSYIPDFVIKMVRERVSAWWGFLTTNCLSSNKRITFEVIILSQPLFSASIACVMGLSTNKLKDARVLSSKNCTCVIPTLSNCSFIFLCQRLAVCQSKKPAFSSGLSNANSKSGVSRFFTGK